MRRLVVVDHIVDGIGEEGLQVLGELFVETEPAEEVRNDVDGFLFVVRFGCQVGTDADFFVDVVDRQLREGSISRFFTDTCDCFDEVVIDEEDAVLADGVIGFFEIECKLSCIFFV